MTVARWRRIVNPAGFPVGPALSRDDVSVASAICPQQCGRTSGADFLSHSMSGPGVIGASEDPPLPSRILIVSGMGMRGKMEDALSDRASGFFTPAVPVIVNRYGVFRSGTIFRFCQRAATERIAEWLRDQACCTRDDNSRGRPCVIAHSFGAWLVGHALEQNPDIRVGRIIVAGSVLRPDFDWSTLLADGRAEAVLNHCGRLDMWSWVSEFFIPDSGPSGYRGFAACAGVYNRFEPYFRHTTFFQDRYIDKVHRDLWLPFLKAPAQELPGLVGTAKSPPWRQRSWLMRANLIRAILLLALTAALTECLLTAGRVLAGLQW
jgi:pimeloyl-ACP methyl ester carboxylesterase